MLALPNCASLEIAKIRESASSEKGEALVSEQSRLLEVKMLPVASSAPVKLGPDGGVFICGGEEEIVPKTNGNEEHVSALDVLQDGSDCLLCLVVPGGEKAVDFEFVDLGEMLCDASPYEPVSYVREECLPVCTGSPVTFGRICARRRLLTSVVDPIKLCLVRLVLRLMHCCAR